MCSVENQVRAYRLKAHMTTRHNFIIKTEKLIFIKEIYVFSTCLRINPFISHFCKMYAREEELGGAHGLGQPESSPNWVGF